MQFTLRALGWGIAIYAIMYLLWSGLLIYGLAAGVLSLILRIGTLALVTTIAARATRLQSWKDLLPYSIAWALITIALDAVFLVPYSGWSLYATGSVWIGYALVVILPLFSTMHLFKPRSAARTF